VTEGERLLVVTDTLPPDANGVALVAMRTAEIFAAKVPVTLLGPRCKVVPANITHIGMSRSPIPMYDFHLPWPHPTAIPRAVKQSTRVLIHSQGMVGVAALFHAWRLKRPTTLFLHADYRQLVRHNFSRLLLPFGIEFIGMMLERWAVKMADRTIAANLDSPHAGVETLELRPPLFRGEAMRTKGSDGAFTIAYHGRVRQEKALDVTLRSFAAANTGGLRKRFRIVGDGTSLESVLALASSLGIEVDHVPWCTDPQAYIASADAYVMSSREETFSMATLEAMGCGLPVIARRVGSIPTYLHDGDNGLLFSDDAELPRLIERLARDGALRCHLGAAATANASEESIWQSFARAAEPDLV
jgi:1,2-diacylglycerol 3-alpha-glucosyltransferase